MDAKSVVAIVKGRFSWKRRSRTVWCERSSPSREDWTASCQRDQPLSSSRTWSAPMAVDRGATTDPRICKSLADQVRERGGRAIIAESSAIGVDTEEAFKVCGYEALRARGYEVVDLKKSVLVTVPVPMGTVLKELTLPQLVLQADAVISVPKMKSMTSRSPPWRSRT